MRLFLKIAMVGSFVGLLLAVGCGDKSSPSAPATVNPVGTWKVTQSGSSITIINSANNTFSEDLAGMSTMAGTYAINGSKIIFSYTNCIVFGAAVTCSDPDTGTISGNSMVMKNGDGSTYTLTRQ